MDEAVGDKLIGGESYASGGTVTSGTWTEGNMTVTWDPPTVTSDGMVFVPTKSAQPVVKDRSPHTKAVRFKVEDFDSDDGTFSGYASVFDVVDSYGDVVERGAFKRTIDHWEQKGAPIPILYQHDPYDPIGVTEHAEEDERGLYVEGRLLLDLPRAQQTRTMMNSKLLGGLSIGYSIINGMWDKVEEVYRLTELRLWEWSPVTWPANESTSYSTVKGLAAGGDPEYVLYLIRKAASEMVGKDIDPDQLHAATVALLALRPPSTDADSGDHSAKAAEAVVPASGAEPQPGKDEAAIAAFQQTLDALRGFINERR